MFFHKKNRYELDMTTANNALQNILSTCNQPVNTIPFDKLVLRKKVNAASYNRLIVATAVIFVLVLLGGVFLDLSPVWFVIGAALAGIVLKNWEVRKA